MRKFTLFVALVLIASVAFCQGNFTAKSAREAGVIPSSGNVLKVSTMLTEDFEAWVIPSAMNGWTNAVTCTAVTWDTVSYAPHGGVRNVHCQYDPALSTQDEKLITPALNLTNASSVTVKFWWNGSKYWSIYPNDNCDLNLLYSLDGGTTWNATPLWSEESGDTSLFVNWTWAQATVTANGAAGCGTAKFALQYYGSDGAEFSVDDFTIDTAGGTGSGISVPLMQSYMRVYPSPAVNTIKLESSDMMGDIRIYNTMGMLVKSIVADQANITLDVSTLSEGVYYMEIMRESGKITRMINISR